MFNLYVWPDGSWLSSEDKADLEHKISWAGDDYRTLRIPLDVSEDAIDHVAYLAANGHSNDYIHGFIAGLCHD